eukprot:3356673-Prymnesium_polylepis.1
MTVSSARIGVMTSEKRSRGAEPCPGGATSRPDPTPRASEEGGGEACSHLLNESPKGCGPMELPPRQSIRRCALTTRS